MAVIADLIFSLLGILTSIILIFSTTYLMVNKRRTLFLMPFFLMGILLCFRSSFSFYGIFSQKIWLITELSWAILFFWLILNLRSKNE